MSDNYSTLDLSGLDALEEVVRQLSKSSIDVGIFADADGRPDGKSNATIGAVQELGYPEGNIPARSWLDEPLRNGLEKKLEGLTLEHKKAPVILEKIGLAAVLVVQEAFDASGPGWPPPKDRIGKPLVDTGTLQGSVGFRVNLGTASS